MDGIKVYCPNIEGKFCKLALTCAKSAGSDVIACLVPISAISPMFNLLTINEILISV